MSIPTDDGRWLRRETQVTRFFPNTRRASFVTSVAILATGSMMIVIETQDGKKLEVKFDTSGLIELKEAVALLERERLALFDADMRS